MHVWQRQCFQRGKNITLQVSSIILDWVERRKSDKHSQVSTGIHHLCFLIHQDMSKQLPMFASDSTLVSLPSLYLHDWCSPSKLWATLNTSNLDFIKTRKKTAVRLLRSFGISSWFGKSNLCPVFSIGKIPLHNIHQPPKYYESRCVPAHLKKTVTY